MILVGDIGGTKSLFGLYDGECCVAERRLANADFRGFDEALAEFLQGHKDLKIHRACFALAGPVRAGQRFAGLTNLLWTLDADAVTRTHDIPRVCLVNDFVAAAMGAVTSLSGQLATIREGLPLECAPRLVLGAGTGLGVALALPDTNGWRIVGSEGGHMGFSPADATQIALMQFLRGRHDRIIWEHVVSGPGLALIHEFLGSETMLPADIGKLALSDPGSMAAQSLNLFLFAYGAFAGDMALATLSRGGVYLAGGIAANVLPALQPANGEFLRAFLNKAEHRALMEDIPIRVVTDPAVGLRGARILANNIDPNQ